MPTVAHIATQKILSLIEAGKPLKWKFYQLAPQNFISKRAYTGSNHFLLLFAEQMKSPFYMTMNQINELGLKLRKGSKGEFVVYQKLPQAKRDESGSVTGEVEGYYMLRYYHVFNAADVEGIELPNIEQTQPNVEEFLSQLTIVPIEHRARVQGSYNPTAHKILLPFRERFTSIQEYYSVIFHELAHSTWQALGREISNDKQSAIYKQEELVAEMTSVFLSAHFGIETTFQNSAAYLQHYSSGNGKNILSVIGYAEKAMQYILSNGNTKAPE